MYKHFADRRHVHGYVARHDLSLSEILKYYSIQMMLVPIKSGAERLASIFVTRETHVISAINLVLYNRTNSKQRLDAWRRLSGVWD